MRPPSDQLREEVSQRTESSILSNLGPQEQEQRLENLLDYIDLSMNQSVTGIDQLAELAEDQAEDQLATVDAWVSLISYAVARVYAPASPWPRRRAGWEQSIVLKLRQIVKRLQSLLIPVARALHAVHFSIAVGFPWGVSIGMSF
jgi:ABC-type proline/glycine betaine transport system permease subunit